MGFNSAFKGLKTPGTGV